LWAVWEKPDFAKACAIEANQYIEKLDPAMGTIRRVFDSGALMGARIKVLLKEWNISDIDDKWKLEHVNSINNKNIKVLTDECMQRIGLIKPSGIIYSLYNRMLDKVFPEIYSPEAIKNLIGEKS